MTHSNVTHEKRSHGKRRCQCAALIGDGRAAEFLLLGRFSKWSRHLHPRKWQRDQQGDHAQSTIVGLGLDYV